MVPFSLRAFAASSIPVGLELYSVRNALKEDLTGTVRTVGQMGYQCVEFYAPYYDWTEPQTKDMRKLLDDLGIRCYSTHNSDTYFTPEKLKRASDMNLILGSKYVVMSSSQPNAGWDGWKQVADTLNSAADQLQAAGLKPGYHNHELEFTPVKGKRPIEFLAKNARSFEEIRIALEAGHGVKLSGFGNFQLRDKPQRPGRNPKTGEEIPITARRVVTFHASQKLKALVEYTTTYFT